MCGKVNLDPEPTGRLAFAARLKVFRNETYIQAPEPTACQQTRFPRTHEDALGPRHIEQAPEDGSQEVGSVPAIQAWRKLTSEGLPRSWRISHGSDLKAVQQGGRHRRTPRLDISWRSNDLDHPRLGVVVPRFGASAVARNRVQRRLRECSRRRILPNLRAVDLVVRARPAVYEAASEELSADLDQWLQSISE